MSVPGLPGVVDSGQPRRRVWGVPGPRFGLGALLVGIAAATVAVPPLIAPDHKRGAAPAAAPPASPTPPGQLVPAVTEPRSAAPARGPRPCSSAAAGGTVALSARPSCAIYAGGLGNGWSVTGDGMKVLPGAVVPDTKEPAMRVERSRPATPATALTISAKQPIGVPAGGRLTLRVWGGRDFGTVLTLSAGPGGTGSVTLIAPAERWTTYTVKLAELTRGDRLTRLDVAVVADQVPHVNRFFLDDIALAH
ncbi:MAG: hypothetical protein QOC94_1154 [Actinoplanes sp.]|nr:hypothetical protein [Actinoplanes sp.]